MLPLHAIPTEVIRKGSRPYRGFITGLRINLPKEDWPLRRHLDRPQSPLSAEKAAELALDVTPIFEVIAKLFGYDLQLLKAGNGDCGVEGHDWNRYGTQDRVPQVVRWRADGGEALLCIGPDNVHHFAQVVGLADEVMAPKMAQVFEAIGEMGHQKREASIDRPAGDLLEKVMLDQSNTPQGLSASFWCEPQDEQLTAQQAEEVQKLRFSCRISFGTPRSIEFHTGTMRLAPLQQPRVPGKRVALVGRRNPFPAELPPGEPMPGFLLKQLYAESVKDVERLMQMMMASTFESQVERVNDFLYSEELAVTVGDPAENERAYALAYLIGHAQAGKILTMGDVIKKTTFGREFRSTPAKNLLGTQSIKKLYAGHVVPGADLLEMAITNVHHEAELALVRPPEKFELKGKVIASEDLVLQRDQDATFAKAHKLEKPYTALYRGLPIRVTDSYVVSHGDGSEALACDYYVDHQNQALHFVSLYRAKRG
jgi:hypothetical protein